VALAEKINADGLALYKDVSNAVDASQHDLAALAAVRKAMNVAKIPTAGRVAVWDPEADAAFTTIPAIIAATIASISKGARTCIRKSFILPPPHLPFPTYLSSSTAPSGIQFVSPSS
jgi:hypothetical protein